ncbi:hypothetical protein HPB50_008231 [Hyalomma asiaticum]|uniref:Uncharacterized protein n=1 Tax=Hyalomma asiaticum TaxID=266040 RepID=A0ACB7SHN0_HYAAI|nr:hypothetical protein HPB50_008231 [Hyalomma asiaticum]
MQVPLGRLNEHLQNCRYENAVCESCNVLPVHPHDECPKRLVRCHRRRHQNKCADVLDGGHDCQQTIHGSVEQKPAKLYNQRYDTMRKVSRLSLQIRDIDTIMMYKYESAVCESCNVLPVLPHDECPKRLVRCHRRRQQNKCADVLDGGHDSQQTIHESVEQKPAKLYEQRYEAMREVSRLSLQIRDIDTIMTIYERAQRQDVDTSD